jgi:hypothetical protein
MVYEDLHWSDPTTRGFDECLIAFDVKCGVLKLCVDLIQGFDTASRSI